MFKFWIPVVAAAENSAKNCGTINRMKPFQAIVLFLFLLIHIHPVAAETYIVEKGDTFSVIAFENGLTVDQLAAANPGVDPLLLHIGDALIIPPSDETAYNDFLQELYSAYVQEVGTECFVLPSQRVSCISRVHNPGDRAVTNLSLKIDLADGSGRHMEAFSGLSMSQLLPGEELPVLFHLTEPSTTFTSFTIELSVLDFDLYEETVNSFRIPDTEWIYSSTVVGDGLSAAVHVALDGYGSLAEKEINLFAAAYRADGSPVGVRAWHGVPQPAYDLTVYSLSDPIHSVKVWAEAF